MTTAGADASARRSWRDRAAEFVYTLSTRVLSGLLRGWRRIGRFLARRWHALAPSLVAFQRRLHREVNVLPYVTARDAREAALVRQSAVVAALASRSDFSERPPVVNETSNQAHRHDPRDAVAREISLQWELGDERRLLAGRAADVVEALVNDAALESGRSVAAILEQTQPVVTVRPLSRLLRAAQPELYSWRVVIQTTDPPFFQRRMAGLAKWLGIGLDVARGAPVEPQAGCRRTDGQVGTVSGAQSRSDGRVYGITCAHVLSPECECAAWSQNSGASLSGADAALLTSSDCFRFPGPDARLFEPESHTDWDRLIAEETTVVRLGGGPGNRRGVVLSEAPSFKNGEALCRFPSLAIRPRKFRYGPVPWPLVRRAFSRSGDSGSWIVESNSNRWVGIVVCRTGGNTLAHQAKPLLDYFDRCLEDFAGVRSESDALRAEE
jgi:hypothetical protein